MFVRGDLVPTALGTFQCLVKHAQTALDSTRRAGTQTHALWANSVSPACPLNCPRATHLRGRLRTSELTCLQATLPTPRISEDRSLTPPRPAPERPIIPLCSTLNPVPQRRLSGPPVSF